MRWCELSWLLLLVVVHLWCKAQNAHWGINLWFLLPSRFPCKTLYKESENLNPEFEQATSKLTALNASGDRHVSWSLPVTPFSPFTVFHPFYQLVPGEVRYTSCRESPS